MKTEAAGKARRVGGIKRVSTYVLACYGCGKWIDFTGEGGWTGSETREGIQGWIDGSEMTYPWEKTCGSACESIVLKRRREQVETRAQQHRRDRLALSPPTTRKRAGKP